jgi:hypothetical protein
VSKGFFAALLGAGALAVTTVTVGISGADATAPRLTHMPGLHAKRVCTAPRAGHAACLAKVLVDKSGAIPMATSPLASALSPAQLRAAYRLNGTSGGGTVAIVDAYGYPNLERDLAVYRQRYGLPACTTANKCLRILDQFGGVNAPRTDVGWAQEQALDVDAVSATCPDCKIVVVQTKTNSFANLGQGVITASKQSGVVAISNSYGGSDAADSTYGVYYNHPGIAVTASTGDNGYRGGSYPASSTYVTAVGGTTLKMSDTTRVSETAWSGAGSGCSTYNAAVAASSTFDTGCAKRAMADVSGARPEHRCSERVRADDLEELVVVAVRRHQRVRADHRVGLRAGRWWLQQHHAVPACREPVRHHRGRQRLMPHRAVVQGTCGLGRSDRSRHPEGHGGVLTPTTRPAKGAARMVDPLRPAAGRPREAGVLVA